MHNGGCVPHDELKIRAELERILSSSDFLGSERHRRFLTYIVEETLAGRGDRLKAYNIATTAFNRGPDFDPQQDSIVRIEAGRLRRALEHYYLTEGHDNDLQIVVPKGSYVPQFRPAGNGSLADAGSPVPAPSCPRRATRVFVMPFDAEGPRETMPELSRSFTRQVIMGLTRFSSVHVYSAESSGKVPLRLRGEVLPEELVVDFILSGTISLNATGFSVDLLLQEAETLRFIWTEHIVRKLPPEGVHHVRDEVAALVAQRLARPYGILFSLALVSGGESARTLDGYRAVVEFYQYTRTFRKDRLEPTRRLLEESVANDPSFAEGLACLSMLYSQHARFMSSNSATLLQYAERAHLLARQALLLAPRSSNAHHALALALWFSGDTTASLEAYETAFSLNPSDTDLMADMGLRYCILMDWERGVPLIEESYRLNPDQSSTYRLGLALYHFTERQYAEALRQALLIDAPDVVYLHVTVAACAQRLGDHDRAKEAIAQIEQIEPGYAQRVESDFATRNVPATLSEGLIAALRDAGLGRPAAPKAVRVT